MVREATSLALLQDDFASILQTIKAGRRTFANLRQAMVYTLAVHERIVELAMLPVPFGLALVLAPLRIAFLELVIHLACSLVFAAEDGDSGLLHQPPRRTGAELLTTTHVTQSLLQGALLTAIEVGVYAGMLGRGMPCGMASTAAFVALVSANASLILPWRSDWPWCPCCT